MQPGRLPFQFDWVLQHQIGLILHLFGTAEFDIKTSETQGCPAFPSSVGRILDEHKYVGRYAVALDSDPLMVTSVRMGHFFLAVD